MKRIKLLILALSITGGVVAQSNIRWSNFLLDSYSINPASVDKYFANLKVGGQYRNQWIGFEGAPRTYSGFVSSYIDPVFSQIGLRFMADKIGYTHAMDISPTYAFNINGGSRSNNVTWVLNLGIAGHIQNSYYDDTKFVFDDGTGQTEYDLPNDVYEKKWSGNFDVGAEFAITFGDKSREVELLFGAVAQNLLSYWKNDLTPFANTNFGYGQLKHPINNSQDFLFGASFMHSKNQYAPDKFSSDIYQWEFDLKYRFYFKEKQSSFQQFLSPGIVFRTKRTWAPNTRELGIMLEYEWMRFVTIAGTYEYPLSTLTQAANTWGTLELIAIFRFGHPSTKPYDKNYKDETWICKIPSGETHDYGVYKK